jgi:drug/metabolite transporter (DMT)-like permease
LKNLSSHTKALLAVAIISITWGTTWLPSKLLVADNGVPPMQISSLRMLFAGAVFVAFFLIKGHSLPTIKQFGKIIILSIFFIVLANAFSLISLQYKSIPSGIGALLGATVPLWVALISIFIFRKQKITAQITGGLVFGFGGIIVVFSKDLHALTQPDFLKPLFYSSLASIAWSLGTLLNAKKDAAINPFNNLGWQMISGGIILFIASYIFEDRVALKEISLQSWSYFTYLVIIGSFISFASFIYALKHLPATQVSTYAYINPLVALILGHYMHKEDFTWYIVLGSLITLLGVYLVNRGFEKQKFEEE